MPDRAGQAAVSWCVHDGRRCIVPAKETSHVHPRTMGGRASAAPGGPDEPEPVVLAVQIWRHGGPEELVVGERADPVPAAGQVVVRNRWIGVNYVDLQHREGRPYPVQLPLIPGTEAAGTVVAVGPGADRDLVGAPVAHFGHLVGAYAELTAVPLEFVVPLPPDAPLDIAAAVAVAPPDTS